MTKLLTGLIGVFLVVSLTACGGSEGPDEFLVLPTKPLEQPKDYSKLPTPDAKGRNLADQRPLEDSVVALGGRRGVLDSNRINSGEQALITAASRYGVTSNIRELLAKENEGKRGKRTGDRLLYRIAGVEDPQGNGSADAIDPNAMLFWLRAKGVRTPTAPPS